MALSVGVVLARAAREREETQRRERERTIGLLPGEAPAYAFRRMALAQVELAIELLRESDGSAPSEKAVHETRKALKRLRALLRLFEDELGSTTFARESSALREIAARLAGARDAEVMLGTLDSLIERHPGKLRRRKGVRKLRRALLRQRGQAARALDRDTVTRASAELRALRARVQQWSLPELGELDLIEGGFARIYQQGRKRHRRAARSRGKDTEAMHDWRKRVKSLRYTAEMLERRMPGKLKPGARAKQLKALARRADDLGEALGEDHDLAMLADWLRRSAKAKPKPRRSRSERRASKLVLQLIARRRRKLRKQTMRDGRRLYRRSAKQLVRRLS